MLTQFMNLSPLDWPSPEKRKAFRSMLSKLATVKIRDIAESNERAPVKDLFISLSLEMSSRTQRSKDSVQTDLFSVLGN